MNRETLVANKEVVRRLYEDVFATGSSAVAAALVDDAYVAPNGSRGPQAFLETVQDLRRAFPDIRYTVEDLVAEGDRVVARWTWRGTHRGPFRAFPPSNEQRASSGMAIHRVVDGKVREIWVLTDRLGFLEQLGAVPPGLAAGPPKRAALPDAQ